MEELNIHEIEHINGGWAFAVITGLAGAFALGRALGKLAQK